MDTAAPLTVSIGVTCFPDDGASADDLLRAGDQALYAAKKLGRDRTVLYNAEVIADVVPGEAAAEAQTPASCPWCWCWPRRSMRATRARRSTPRRWAATRAPPRRASACRRARSSAWPSRACFTTWARSAWPTRFSRSRGRSTTTSGRRFAGTPSWGRASWRARTSPTSRSGSSPITSGWTGAAIRSACGARRSRSEPASSRWPTPTRR